MEETILKVKDLSIKFDIGLNIKKFTAVRNVDFELKKGHVLGIVGESGSGKSQIALSILGLCDKNASVSGEIIYKNTNLLKLSETQLNKFRWNHIAIVLQNAMSTFNPYMTLRDQLIEPLVYHKGVSVQDAERKAIELLDLVKIPDVKNRILLYPHEFSGGMLQRAMIAMALICDPKILIADEITSGVDVTTQIQILKLLHEVQRNMGMSLIFISHDLGVLSKIANEVIVMYCGHIMEYTTMKNLIYNPVSPYTKGLINSIPQLDKNSERLEYIEGETPNVDNMPAGCPFCTRCKFALPKCFTQKPNLKNVEEEHSVSCFL